MDAYQDRHEILKLRVQHPMHDMTSVGPQALQSTTIYMALSSHSPHGYSLGLALRGNACNVTDPALHVAFVGLKQWWPHSLDFSKHDDR